MKKRITKTEKGFTLVELVVVIAIIGVLACLIIPSVINYVKKAARRSDMATASLIGKAAVALIADDPVYYSEFRYGKAEGHNPARVIYTPAPYTGGPGSYEVTAIAKLNSQEISNGANRHTWVDSQPPGYKFFVEALNDDDAIVKDNGDTRLVIKTAEYKGHDLNRWWIVRRRDTNALEVWVGDGSGKCGQWALGYCYRLWPSPDPEFY